MKLAAIAVFAFIPASALAEMVCDGTYISADKSIVAEEVEGGFRIGNEVIKLRSCGSGFYCSYEIVDGARKPSDKLALNVATALPPELSYLHPTRGEILLVANCHGEVDDTPRRDLTNE